MGFTERSMATEYSLQDGDTLQMIAERETAGGNSLTAEEIALFNWGTADADIIEEFLRDELGCYRRGEDKRFVISADAEPRSSLLIPQAFTRSGLASNTTHTLVVKKPSVPPTQFEGCCKIKGITFDFDSSFIRPSVVGDLAAVELEMQKHPDAKILIYGHTDKVGSEQYNKLLSERRAKSVYAFITNQPDIWEDLYNQEGWRIKCVQEILKDMGDPYDPGPVDGIDGPQTKRAVREFQDDNGLTVDGIAGPNTRAELFSTYMSGKHDIEIDDSKFMNPKHIGCGEFNPIKDTEEPHEPNRRVTFYFFNENRLPVIPCRHGVLTPCKRQISNPILRYKDEFTCSFYDSIAQRCACENPGRPKKTTPPVVAVTVAIKAENGTDPPPTTVYVSKKIRLKAVSSSGTGTYVWSTTSSRVTLENVKNQTVTVVAGKKSSSAPDSEEIQVIFTPAGKDALAPEKHKMGVCTVKFSEAYKRPERHPWGYDEYQEILCRDMDGKKFKEQPGPAMDFISVKSAEPGLVLFSTPETGWVKVTIEGCKPEEVFFRSKNPTVCKVKSKKADKTPFLLEIEGNPLVTKRATKIEARIGSLYGQLAAELGVVVLEELKYRAAWFRVVDPKSPKTKLSHALTAQELQDTLDYYYRQGVAKWDISGGTKETEVEYDPHKTGYLALEPGVTTPAEKKIMDKCSSRRTRIIYVKNINWFYYFAKDAAKTDTKITLKKYGGTYLGYLGTNKYQVLDKNKQSVIVKIKSVDTSTGVVELEAALGKDCKKADKAALIFPLAGLSGNPAWVEEMPTKVDLCNVAGHELGHQVAGFADIGERRNIMHGTSESGGLLRHRPLTKYYKTAEKEKQWVLMKGR